MKSRLMLPLALLLGVAFGLQKIVDVSHLLAVFSLFTRFYFLLVALTVVPILMFSMIRSVSRLAKSKALLGTFTRIIASILVVMLICSILAVTFYTVVSWIYPLSTEDTQEVIAFNSSKTEESIPLEEGSGTLSDSMLRPEAVERFLLSIIPSNIYQSMVIEQLPALIFFSLLLGLMLGIIRHAKVTLLVDFIHSLNLSFQKIFHWLMYFLPLTLFILSARYVQEANLSVLRSTLFFFLVFASVFLVSIVAVIIVFMIRRETSFVKAFSQIVYPAILAVYANNYIVALPAAIKIFGNEKESMGEEPAAAGTAVATLFSLNNVGYFLFLNIFALISMMVSGIAITPVSLGIVFFAAFLVSLTSSVYATHESMAQEHSTLLFSMLSPLGVVAYFTSGFWLIVFYLLLPLQILYSVIVNQCMIALLLPKPSQEAQLIAEGAEQGYDFDEAELIALDEEEAPFVGSTVIEDKENLALAMATSAESSDTSGSGFSSEKTQDESQKRKERASSPKGALLSISFRLSVVVLTTVLIIGYGFLSNLINYSGSVVSLYSMADSFLANLTDNASNKIENYLELPLRTLHDINVFINNKGMFDDNEDTVKFIYEIMEGQPEFISLYYGSNDGTFRMVKRMVDGSFSIRRVEQEGGAIISDWEHENTDYDRAFPDSVESLDSGYDPRRRIWYEAAVEGRGTTWSDVYTFASDGQLGLTTALPVYNSDGTLRGVFGIDIGLLEFSNFLNDLDIGTNGHAFVIEKDTKEFLAVSLPGARAANDLYYLETEGEEQSVKRISMDTTLSPYYTMGYNAYRNGGTITKNSGPLINFFQFLLGRLQDQDESVDENYSFRYEKKLYLTSISDLVPDVGIEWQLGLIVSVDDFMLGVNQNNTVILIFSIFLIIFVGFIGSTIASKISDPITKLSSEMEVVKDLKIETVSPRHQSRILEIRNMNTAFDSMLSGLLSFKKYVPADLVTQLIQMRGSAEIGGARQVVTMMFSDIRGFTSLSEELPPEELIDQLERYFDLFSDILLQAHATIDKYIGDSIMAFWGAPEEDLKHAIHACHAAVQFQRELRKSNLAKHFYTRIGIHTGEPVVGNIGSRKRLNYTVIGDPVNITSRLENLNKYYGSSIIISEATLAEVQDSFEVRYLDNVAVKGKKQGMKIYEVIGDKGCVDLLQHGSETTQHIQQFLSMYNLGVRYYQERQWGKAVHYFARAYNMRKHDQSAKLMYLRCYKFYQSPPPDDWDGVVMFREK